MSADEWAGIRVYMQDRSRFQRDARATTQSMNEMGHAADMLGKHVEDAGHRSFLMNQALFTMRRLIYGATLAVGAMATAVGALGLRFDATMEQSQVAFTTLLGSAQAARDELNFLYELAAKTPFEFTGIQQVARQFLGWGFSIQEVNKYLQVMANVIAGMGGDVSVMDAVVRAFGQMRSAGVVRMQDLMQLQQAIPGVMEILRTQLNLSQAQVGNIGRLGLRSDVAIAAIMRGLQQDPRFKGAAKALEGTVTGQLSTLHDYASRLFGDIMMAPFRAAKKQLPTINKDMQVLSNTLTNQGFGAFVKKLDEMTHAGGRLEGAIMIVTHFARAFGLVLRNIVWPVLNDVAKITGPILIPLMLLLAGTLSWLAKHARLVRWALVALVTYLVLVRLNMLRIYLLSKTWGLLWKLQLIPVILRTRWALIVTKLTMIQVRWQMFLLAVRLKGLRAGFKATYGQMFLTSKWGKILIPIFKGLRTGVLLLTRALWGATTAVVTFLLTNPIGWAILLVAALVLLYWKVEWFRKKVNALVGWIWQHWEMLGPIFLSVLGPFGAIIYAVGLLIKHFNDLKKAAVGALGWIKKAVGWAGKIGGGAIHFVTSHIPGLATGGTATQSGWTVVGEHGPELRYMPVGATVVPLQGRAPALEPMDGDLSLTAPIVLVLPDGKVLAETVAKVKVKREARK